MSGKIKSKDLSYDTSLPPFLQRLHAQKAGLGDGDRHERDVARPRRAKDPNDDDGPTVVDESGETLSKDQIQQLTDKSKAEEGSGDNATDAAVAGGKLQTSGDPASSVNVDGPDDVKRREQKLTDGVAQKKRKAAKIVGDDEIETLVPEEESTKPTKKAKKKAKPIKLAFDADDEG